MRGEWAHVHATILLHLLDYQGESLVLLASMHAAQHASLEEHMLGPHTLVLLGQHFVVVDKVWQNNMSKDMKCAPEFT